jgi:SAM-dependent methyltransferase
MKDHVKELRGLDYWIRRYEKYGYRVPGTSNRKDQRKEYAEKIGFVSARIPKDIRTLDYGCGIGHYSPLFGDYLGYDPVRIAIDLAQERHPKKKFTKSEHEAISFEPELVLFATVLQHIEKPGLTVKKFKQADYWVFFENISNVENRNYIFFRNEEFYRKLAEGREIETDVFYQEYTNAAGDQIIEPHLLLIAKK